MRSSFWFGSLCGLMNAFLCQSALSADSSVLDTFESTCLTDGRSFEQLRSSFLARSWADLTETPPPELRKIEEAIDNKSINMPAGLEVKRHAVFVSNQQPNKLLARIYLIHFQDLRFVNCAVYDLDGTKEQMVGIDLGRFSSEKPIIDESEDIVTYRWRLADKLSGYSGVGKAFVPKSSSASQASGFHGLSLYTIVQEKIQ